MNDLHSKIVAKAEQIRCYLRTYGDLSPELRELLGTTAAILDLASVSKVTPILGLQEALIRQINFWREAALDEEREGHQVNADKCRARYLTLQSVLDETDDGRESDD